MGKAKASNAYNFSCDRGRQFDLIFVANREADPVDDVAEPSADGGNVGHVDVDVAEGAGDFLNELGSFVSGGEEVSLEVEVAVLVAFDRDQFESLGFGPAVNYLEDVVVGNQLGNPSLGFHDWLAVETRVFRLEEQGGGLLLVGHFTELLG